LGWMRIETIRVVSKKTGRETAQTQ